MVKIAMGCLHAWLLRIWRWPAVVLMIVLPLSAAVLDFLEDEPSDLWFAHMTYDSGVVIAILIGSLVPNAHNLRRRRRSIATLLFFMVVLASMANFEANLQILGSGPDAFIDQVFWPIAFCIAALWGMGIRRLILGSSRGKSPTSDHGQAPG